MLTADLNHLRTVKPEKHKQFAVENDMYQYTLSAKTGDNVNKCFYNIAADLAGVVLTKPEVEVTTSIVSAEIVNHARHDPEVEAPDITAKKSGCTIS